MLSKLRRLCLPAKNLYNPRLTLPLRHVAPITHSQRSFASDNMFCMQCEQTSHGTGCTTQGICGKLPETAAMQDLLLYTNNGLSQYVHAMDEQKLEPQLRERARAHLLESWFSTLTNVNFSEERMVEYIENAIDIREEIKGKFRQIFPEQQEFERIQNSPCNYRLPQNADSEELCADAIRLAGTVVTKENIGDANCSGLRECAAYGMKGSMAYFDHAELMHKSAPNGAYSQEDRDQVYGQLFAACNDLCSTTKDLQFWIDLNMRVGATNVKIMEMLDKAHNVLYGEPEPTEVSSTPLPGKCVLVSGHDVLDVKRILDQIDKKGYDINVYTHGELLPAHGYPEVKKHKRLAGHFGGAWQNQYKEFKLFPGPILMTSNCLMPPRRKYKDQLFTTNCVGYDDVKHINCSDEKELDTLLQKAMECDGFDDSTIEAWKDVKPHVTGFGHAALLAKADVVLDAIKSGDLQHIFVIGGCDGSEKSRSYFTDLGAMTPDNSIILTMGCGKYRLHGLELGDIGGIPRILDMGQCNDAYGAVVVALKLAEALKTDVHSLPLHFAVSWFEQKAVAIFLSLLHLGIKNIHLGPVLPAFLTDDVRKYLFENMGVQQVNFDDANADLKRMLAETPVAPAAEEAQAQQEDQETGFFASIRRFFK
eukprot:370155_1